MNWTFLPPWSLYAIAVAAVLLVVFVALRAAGERHHVPVRRQYLSLALRLVAILILITIALNPTAMKMRDIEGKPDLTVLIDTSHSMSVRDVEGESRLAAALAQLNDPAVRRMLEDQFTLDVRTFDSDLRAATLAALSHDAAAGRASDLGGALTSAIADTAERKLHAGVLVISDGNPTSSGAMDAARMALARSVPLWTWSLGDLVPRRDLAIDLHSAQVLAFANDEVDLAATVHQVGYDHQAMQVQVLRGDEVVHELEVVPDETGAAPVRVTVTAPAAGEERFVFRVVEAANESEKDNNERAVFVRVVGQKVRVLLVEGQPHWETKFLVQHLKRSDRIDLTAISRLSDDRQFAVVTTASTDERRETGDLFPRTAEDFLQYDVIIMGRGCDAFFDENTEQYLTDFVAERGGSLVFSRGKSYGGRFPPLAKFEPVVWGDGVEQSVRMVPVSGGGRSNRGGGGPLYEMSPSGDIDELLERLPRFDQITHTLGTKGVAEVMASGEALRQGLTTEEPPVIMAYQLYGQGRVVTINASGLWRWSFREKGQEQDEFVYDRFWSSLLRWLLSFSDFEAGNDVALSAQRRLVTDEEPFQFEIRSRNIDPQAYRPRVIITGPNEVRVEVEPRRKSSANIGTFIAEAGPFAPGEYQVELHNNVGSPSVLTTSIEVVSGSIENRMLSANADLMQALAETSRGRALQTRDVGKLDDIVRQWQLETQLAEQKITLWDRWWLLGVVLAVLGVEWFLRRREGLI